MTIRLLCVPPHYIHRDDESHYYSLPTVMLLVDRHPVLRSSNHVSRSAVPYCREIV